MAILCERGALGPDVGGRLEIAGGAGGAAGGSDTATPRPSGGAGGATVAPAATSVIAILAEPGRPRITAELVAESVRIARPMGAVVEVLCPHGTEPPVDADRVVHLRGSALAEDVAAAVASYASDERPWAVLAPSTAFGREVAGRAAAATGSGLVGDAVALSVLEGRLVAAKPAFSGSLVADITCPDGTQMATVRPGVLAPSASVERATEASVRVRQVATRGRVRLLTERQNDDLETLARAETVIGVGTGVHPDEYELLSPLASLLGAELAATRKVTDKGWAPRARQVGVTGRSIAPRLYVAVGLSGKFNHMVGVRSAGTILAVNADRGAPVFATCDVGVIGDWHEVVPLLASVPSGRVSQRRAAWRRAEGYAACAPSAAARHGRDDFVVRRTRVRARPRRRRARRRGTSSGGTIPPMTTGVSSPASRSAPTTAGARVRWAPLCMETPTTSTSSCADMAAMVSGDCRRPA